MVTKNWGLMSEGERLHPAIHLQCFLQGPLTVYSETKLPLLSWIFTGYFHPAIQNTAGRHTCQQFLTVPLQPRTTAGPNKGGSVWVALNLATGNSYRAIMYLQLLRSSQDLAKRWAKQTPKNMEDVEIHEHSQEMVVFK